VIRSLLAALGIVTAISVRRRLAEETERGAQEHLFWVLCQPGHSLAERAVAFRGWPRWQPTNGAAAQLAELDLAAYVVVRT